MHIIFKVLIISLVTFSVNAQVRPLVHKDEKRKYIVYTPQSYATSPDKKYPVVFNFHGAGMTMAEQMLYTKMNHTADKHDFIVIYPQGIKQDWNVGFGMSYTEGTDDIGFTEAILNAVEKDFRIDISKVFATGLSRGGFFTHRIAAELGNRFSAIAAIGAPMPTQVTQNHTNKTPVGMMIVHGTADKVVLHDGKQGHYYSAKETLNYWKNINQIKDEVATVREINQNKDDGTSLTTTELSNGKKSLLFISIQNGGHTWAGADSFNMGLPIGITSREIDLNESIWHFFQSQK